MNREIIESSNGKMEVVYDVNGIVIFAKKMTVHQGNQAGSSLTTISGFGKLVDFNDIGFTHLKNHDFVQNCVVDFQYVDGNPENSLSDAKMGSLKVFDANGNIISGESFKPNGFTKLVVDGQLVSNPYGFEMSAPIETKEVFGKNIDQIKTNSTATYK